MKAGTFIAILAAVALVVSAALLGGLFLIFGGSAQPEDPEPAPTTPEPTPTATPDPVAMCLDPAPSVGDGPGTTSMTMNDRPVESDAIESRLSLSLTSSDSNEYQQLSVDKNLSVVARQHAEATAGGQEYDYTLADGCELNTVHATVLKDDISTPSSAAVADMLTNEFTQEELTQIQNEHDTVGIGVYIVNGEVHVSVVTLDAAN